MSAEAIGWVFRHSPFSGATFLVHLAIADSVNDQYDNEFWMAQRNLATKTRMDRKTIQRALPELLDGGFLEQLDEKRGVTILYRFLFPDVEVQYETRRRKVRQDVATPGGQDVAGGATGSRRGGDTSPPNPKYSQEPQGGSGSTTYAHHERMRREREEEDRRIASEKQPSIDEIHQDRERAKAES